MYILLRRLCARVAKEEVCERVAKELQKGYERAPEPGGWQRPLSRIRVVLAKRIRKYWSFHQSTGIIKYIS